jgi:hypothetical protein
MFEPMFGYIPPAELSSEAREVFEEVYAGMLTFSSAAPLLGDTGKGKVSLLYKAQERFAPVSKIRQEIGSCVGHGYARADDVLTSVEIALKGEAESWQGYSSSEWLYGTSRVLVGKGRIRGDGSVGAWAASAISEYGTLLRKKYPEVDLSSYSGSREKEWGSPSGFPKELVELGKQHVVRGTAIVRSYEEARDMLANGYPVPVCSNQGFSDKRDDEGFSRPKGIWPHCMLFVAVDDSYKRPGLLCCNRSWGDNWNSGPTRHEQPGGTFWVDADVADKMLSQGDSYALSDKDGYKVRVNDLDNRPW